MDEMKEKLRRDHSYLREVFMREWDPIGSGVPPDEYDAYLSKAYVMMKSGSSAQEIIDYLVEIETNYMGAGMNETTIYRATRTVAEIMKLKT